MHPDIKAFWEKNGVIETDLPWFTNEGKDVCFLGKEGTIRLIYDSGKQLYWFHPTWSGNIGKWYSEKEMLRILRLKSFI